MRRIPWILLTGSFLAIEPLIHQAIQLEDCVGVVRGRGDKATLPVANYVGGSNQVVASMKGTMIQALSGLADNTSTPPLPFYCPTGNCRFPDHGEGWTHYTVGLGSKCVDTSSYVRGPDKLGKMSLPGWGPSIQDPDLLQSPPRISPQMSVGSSDLHRWAKELFKDHTGRGEHVLDYTYSSLASFSILSTTRRDSTCTPKANAHSEVPDGTEPPITCSWGEKGLLDNQEQHRKINIVATSCVLYPCVKTFHGFIENGILHEDLISTIPAHHLQDDDHDRDHPGRAGDPDVMNYTAVANPCTLWTDSLPYLSPSNFFKDSDGHSQETSWPSTDIRMPDTGGEIRNMNNACLFKMQYSYARRLRDFMSAHLFTGNYLPHNDGSRGYTSNSDSTGGTTVWKEASSPKDTGEEEDGLLKPWWLAPLYHDGNREPGDRE